MRLFLFRSALIAVIILIASTTFAQQSRELDPSPSRADQSVDEGLEQTVEKNNEDIPEGQPDPIVQSKQSKQPELNKKPESNKKPEPEQTDINADATFTPTEEISEDKPVAFPVDI